MRKTYVAGVGMIPFLKPGTSADYGQMGASAARLALEDAGVDYRDVAQAFVGYVFGDSASGQRALYDVGLTGIPIVNVNNNCATGSSALFLARQAVASGSVECALALGFEQMVPGALQDVYSDRPSPLDRFLDLADRADPETTKVPMAIRLFGAAAVEYQKRYGASDETFASISVKARRHAEHNERAIFRSALSIEDVLASPKLYGPLTRLQACPPTCGAAAAVLVSESFAKRHGLDMTVAIRGQAMTTDFSSTFAEGSMLKVVGMALTAEAAAKVYAESGIGANDVDVVELHDCFTVNEIITYEGLGLAPEGGAEKFISDGDNTYGGRVVTNPSGGLLAKGHPLGATGLAQCAELTWQLRGTAGSRQVQGARVALQHNLGLGGACVITLYEREGGAAHG
jgi:sterol carrier protein 2